MAGLGEYVGSAEGRTDAAIQKALPENAQTLNLVDPAEFKVGNVAVLDVIKKRQSRRRFTNEPLTLEELSYLLWATQGLRAAHRDGRPSFRTVPSAGARHPFETYVAVHRVEGWNLGSTDIFLSITSFALSIKATRFQMS